MVATDLKKIPDASFSDSIIEMFADNIKKSDVSPPKSMIATLMEKVSFLMLYLRGEILLVNQKRYRISK